MPPAKVGGGEERTATAGGAPRTAVSRGEKHGNVMLEQFDSAFRFRPVSDIVDEDKIRHKAGCAVPMP